MEEKIIQLKDLKYSYKKNTPPALDIDELQINENPLIGLIGINGSGKTTLLKLIGGLLYCPAQSISVYGRTPTTDISARQSILYSMHDMPTDNLRQVRQQIKCYSYAYPDFDIEFAEKMLELFEINSNKKLNALSQGQKSLVHFTCALATRAKITLLDEPFTAVDIAKRKSVYDILLRDYIEHPRTIFISSHNLDEMEDILSEIMLIDKGKLIFYEDIDDVRKMMFRADGSTISDYRSHEDIVEFVDSEIGQYLIANGSTECGLAKELKAKGCHISPVSASDVCVYHTSGISREKMEALWN